MALITAGIQEATAVEDAPDTEDPQMPADAQASIPQVIVTDTP